jgi:hypothetical protein
MTTAGGYASRGQYGPHPPSGPQNVPSPIPTQTRGPLTPWWKPWPRCRCPRCPCPLCPWLVYACPLYPCLPRSVYPGMALTQSSTASMTSIPAHFCRVLMTLPVLFGRLRQWGDVSQVLIPSQRDCPNSYRLMKSPITRSCMRSVLEKHSVRRTSRLIRVRRLMCLLSIFCVFSLPT